MQGGYTALMATIIISLMLMVMVVTEGSTGWSTRFLVLGTEAKEQANALAEGCVDQALAMLATNPAYLGGVTVEFPEGVCSISALDPAEIQSGMATIRTQAVVKDAYSNLVVRYALPRTLLSWEEIPDTTP